MRAPASPDHDRPRSRTTHELETRQSAGRVLASREARRAPCPRSAESARRPRLQSVSQLCMIRSVARKAPRWSSTHGSARLRSARSRRCRPRPERPRRGAQHLDAAASGRSRTLARRSGAAPRWRPRAAGSMRSRRLRSRRRSNRTRRLPTASALRADARGERGGPRPRPVVSEVSGQARARGGSPVAGWAAEPVRPRAPIAALPRRQPAVGGVSSHLR